MTLLQPASDCLGRPALNQAIDNIAFSNFILFKPYLTLTSLQITTMRQKSRITASAQAVARKLAADGRTVTSKIASYELQWMTRSTKLVDFFSFFKTQMRIIWHGNTPQLANWAIPYCSRPLHFACELARVSVFADTTIRTAGISVYEHCTLQFVTSRFMACGTSRGIFCGINMVDLRMAA